MKTFGPYRIKKPLPRRGEHVLAFQAEGEDGVEVLLRVLTTLVDPGDDAYRRFQREFESLQGLFHPNILPVLDAGEVGGKAYYAGPASSFKTLAEYLAEGRVQFEWRDVVEVGVQLAGALEHMHAQGVLHRSLDPGCVVYDIGSGQAQIASFDMVRSFELPSLTMQGVKQAAAMFPVPEVVREQELTERSDVYLLANLLYELLTGERGIRIDYSYRSLAEVGVEAPEALDGLLGRALAEDPELRPRGAAAFRAALEKLLQA